MRLASYALVSIIAVAMGSGSAVADEQTKPGESTPQPTVMSDAELDEVVRAGVDTWFTVWSGMKKSGRGISAEQNSALIGMALNGNSL